MHTNVKNFFSATIFAATLLTCYECQPPSFSKTKINILHNLPTTIKIYSFIKKLILPNVHYFSSKHNILGNSLFLKSSFQWILLGVRFTCCEQFCWRQPTLRVLFSATLCNILLMTHSLKTIFESLKKVNGKFTIGKVIVLCWTI